jgi:hypothetical protein
LLVWNPDLENPVADIDAARSHIGPDGLPAASAGDVDSAAPEAAVTEVSAVMTAMVATHMHAVSAAMTGRSWGEGGEAKGCDSDGSESNLAKHLVSSCVRVRCTGLCLPAHGTQLPQIRFTGIF